MKRPTLRKAAATLAVAAVLFPLFIWSYGLSYAADQAEKHAGVDLDLLAESRRRCAEASARGLLTSCDTYGVDLSKFTPWLGSNINVLRDDVIRMRREAQEDYFAGLAQNVFFALLAVTVIVGILSVSIADSEGAEHEPEASQTEDDADKASRRQIMAEYLVRYMIGQKYGSGEAPIPVGTTKTFVVNAQDRVDAFIQAYNRLTREGHHVGTWDLGNRYQRGEDEGNPFGFTDEEVRRIREVGVQIDRTPGGGAHIESIIEYGLDAEGKPKVR